MSALSEEVKSLSYVAAIEDLRKRAKRSRVARSYIAAGLIGLMCFAVVAVYNSSQYETYSYRALGEKISLNKMRDPGIFLRKSNDLLEELYPDSVVILGRKIDGEDIKDENFTVDERSAYMYELERLVTFYERAQTAYAKQVLAQEKQMDWTASVSSMAFTFGAIAISILLFQTGVSFIRYYSQLAELYDSQASALLASNNDPERFVKFSEMLSPSAVTFGKPPLSVYERAFDAIAAIRERPVK
ncbi:hypothetical protein [Pseudomonas chlororaphis]|uniref:hypothetical protein n=1 Tax=Pseudomonas chlororaphis TaxID=587753 RepID=UPI001CF54A7B|nr:hypothetical protein [Pseudomonas chlororaphis]UCR85462.1 hypothetical protein K9V45_04810 [Pseudomonas chlororaphis]